MCLLTDSLVNTSLEDLLNENLTLSDKSIVEAARTAYDSLTDSQKDMVVNIDGLIKAENAIDALEAQENASKTDKAAAQEVIDLIVKNNAKLDIVKIKTFILEELKNDERN